MDRRTVLKSFGAAGVAPAFSACLPGGTAVADTFSLDLFSVNGIRVRAAIEGSGPLVVMVHGFPELWYSWRHQIRALAAAGFRVVAPDVRGYGGSDKPEPVEAYGMRQMTADVVGLIDALGEESAILIGHDWGAPIVWNTAFLYPEQVRAVAGLSVPASRRGEVSSIELWQTLYQDRFFYQLYFQQEGVAEAELEADVRLSLLKLFYVASGDMAPGQRDALMQKGPDSDLLSNVPAPDVLPDWLTDADLDYFAAAFEAGGFRGPLNRYRSQQRDWEELPELSALTIGQPSCFIAGSRDLVRTFVPGTDMFETAGQFCSDFRGTTIVEGAGHWVQQEAPGAVNEALLGFLDGL